MKIASIILFFLFHSNVFSQTTEDSIKTTINTHYLAIKTHSLTLLNTVHFKKIDYFYFSPEPTCTDSIVLVQVNPKKIEDMIRLNEWTNKNNTKRTIYLLGDVKVIIKVYYCKNEYPPLGMSFNLRRLSEGWKILDYSYIPDENYPPDYE